MARLGAGRERSRRDARSRTKLTHGIGTADNVIARIDSVGLPDVGQGLGIAQDVDGLLQLRQILRTQDDCRRLAVAGDDDATQFGPVRTAKAKFAWARTVRESSPAETRVSIIVSSAST